jgi:chitin disaccharide deacetylase
MRRLIVNADDFGMTLGINRAIAEAQERGIVTSATLMANSHAFDEAAAMARSLTGGAAHFSVGCHVVLVDGEPALPPERVPSLLDPGTRNGSHFRTELSGFALASFRGKLQPDEVEAEAMAQIQCLRAAGVELSHFDTHKHVHMFPAVLRPLLRAAQVCKVPAVRNPFGQVWPLPLGDVLRRRLWKRFAQLNVLRNFAAKFRHEVESHGLRTTDGSLAVLVTGMLDLKLFGKIVDSIPEGTWEFVCHPGYNDADLGRVRTRLRESRAHELELLTSPEAREVLLQRGIELISYREL